MSAPPITRDALEWVLYEHREDALTCYDHEPTAERPGIWCCICGAHDLTVGWREHVAAAILARSEQDAEALHLRIHALADEWDERGSFGYAQQLRALVDWRP